MPSTTTVLPLLRRLSHVSPIRSARVLSWKPCPARSAFLAPTHARRTYATQRDAKPSASSLLSEALDQKQRAAQDGLRDSVGPIPMSGLIQMSRGGERPKKWSELSAGGKVVRTAARTSNLTVILLGAGLTVVLVYALTSELFSKNSPTVIHSQACDKIQASSRIGQYLNAPFKFHNQPPSALRPRHRNPHVSSQIAVDGSGREHMYMTFWVQGASSAAAQAASEGRLAALQAKFSELSDMSLDEMSLALRARSSDAWDSAKTAIRYLVGKPANTPATAASAEETVVERQQEPKGAWSFVGMFSSLRGASANAESSSGSSHQWTEGEVHAELIRNDDGYFVFRYLLVDIPNSRTRQRTRVFVERAPGVPEHEPVMHFG